MGVADDKPHAGQAARPERAQERGPEGAILAVADREPEDLTIALRGHPVATTIALLTTDAPSWALTYVASRKTYGKRV